MLLYNKSQKTAVIIITLNMLFSRSVPVFALLFFFKVGIGKSFMISQMPVHGFDSERGS